MEHHWVRSVSIATCSVVPVCVFDDRRSDDCTYDDDDELDFVPRSASSVIEEIERSFSRMKKIKSRKERTND